MGENQGPNEVPPGGALVTRVVEFSHRNNKSVSKAKGTGKPSSFAHIANAAMLNRLGVLHRHARGHGRKGAWFSAPTYIQIWMGAMVYRVVAQLRSCATR